jgi:hypothetical protein
MSRLTGVLLFIAAGVALLSSVVTPVTEGGVALAFPLKVAVAVLLITPLGFAMGVPFPSGLRRLEEIMPKSIRWAWSINAAASVLGSAGAIVLAIYCGLSNTLLIGALFYILALLAALLSPLGKKYLIAPPVA